MVNTKTVDNALVEYKDNVLTTKDIAAKYGVSASTLTVWATQAGVPLRSRGRRVQDEPTMRHEEIIRLSEIMHYSEVGHKFGISKQAVHRILKRWKPRVKPKRVPFIPGDVIRWRNQTYRVVSADLKNGTLVDSRGKIVRCCTWNAGGIMPKKIGTDPKYTVK